MKCLTVILLLFSVGLYSQDKLSRSEKFGVKGMTYQKDTNKVDPHYVLKCRLAMPEAGNYKTIGITFLDKKGRQMGEVLNYNVRKHSLGFYFLENSSGKKITVMNDNVVFVKSVNDADHKNYRRIKISYVLTNGDTKDLICHIP